MRNQNIDQCWQFQHGLYDEFPDAEKAKSVKIYRAWQSGVFSH